MWITDLQCALVVLYEMYGETCCVESIIGNVITMTNRNKHTIDELLSEDDE